MALQECMNGHLYDTSMYATCPYCSGGVNSGAPRVDFGGGGYVPTMGLDDGGGIGKTVAASGAVPGGGGYDMNGGYNGGGYDMGYNGGGYGGYNGGGYDAGGVVSGQGELGHTVAPKAYQENIEDKKKDKKKEEEENKTVAIGFGPKKEKLDNDPVCGWLVCVEGKGKGKDYRIYGRNNTIGRDEKMDICIKDDPAISREKHARLAYDMKHNTFNLIPAEATNNPYVNDEPVYVPTKLEAYDVIELGESKFVFVPFCCDRFTWQNASTKGEEKDVK